jgi:phage terminase Nu1 subunit (DNA packaging protein)
MKTDGLPCAAEGKAKTVRLRDLLEWHASTTKRETVKSVKLAVPESNAQPTAPDETYEEAITRKTKAEANLKELQLAQRRGQVASIPYLKKVLNASAMATQTQVLAVPSRLATRILGLEDHARAVSILDAEMRQLLTNLATIDAVLEAGNDADDAEDE